MLERRSFLRRLGLAVPSLVVGSEIDLDRLLWVPTPMVTVPDMAWVMRQTLQGLAHNLAFALQVNRDAMDQVFSLRRGDVVRVHLPARYQLHG